MNRLSYTEALLLWIFVPMLPFILLAIILSVLGVKPPKSRGQSWWK